MVGKEVIDVFIRWTLKEEMHHWKRKFKPPLMVDIRQNSTGSVKIDKFRYKTLTIFFMSSFSFMLSVVSLYKLYRIVPPLSNLEDNHKNSKLRRSTRFCLFSISWSKQSSSLSLAMKNIITSDFHLPVTFLSCVNITKIWLTTSVGGYSSKQIKCSPFVYFGSLVIWHPNEVGHLIS